MPEWSNSLAIQNRRWHTGCTLEHRENPWGCPMPLRFVVHAPVVAMKLLSDRRLVVLEKRTAGEILESYGDGPRPGLVMVAVDGDRYLVWRRDLEERTEFIPDGRSDANIE
jgi:hypothetical protein